MNPNVNIQILNIAIQVKNLLMQLENISQTQNMVIPNLSNQLENMGIQTLNIGMQIINTGIITSNSGNGNPNLGQQLKDLGNQIQNFGLNIDNNNQIQMNMQIQMNPMMTNQMMNFNPNPEIWTLKFEDTKSGKYQINISPKKFVRDAINLYKSQANLIPIFHSIAYTSLHISYLHSISAYFHFRYTNIQILLLPIVQVNGWKFWNCYLSFCINCNTMTTRNLCRELIMGPCRI